MVIAFYALPRDGIQLSHDSVAYLYAADTFRQGGGFVYFGYGTPMIQWPLFMPGFLGILGVFTENTQEFMRYFNILLLGASVFTGGLLCRKFITGRFFCNLATALLACSGYFFWIYYHLWSECFFIFFGTLLIYLTVLYIETKQIKYLILSGVISGAMMWTRFTGMELAGLILIVIFLNGKTLRRRFTDTIIYSVIGFVPFCLLLMRNYIVSGMFSGRSKPSVTPFWMNITDTLATFGRFLIPGAEGIQLKAGIIFAAFAAVFTAVIFFIFRHNWRGRKIWLMYILLPVHIVCYIVMAVYSNTNFALDRLSARLYSPIYFVCIILLFWAIEQYCGYFKNKFGFIKICVFAAVLTVCILNIIFTSRFPEMTGHFSNTNLKDDELIKYISDISKPVKIYTNHPGEVVFMTGTDANYTPRKQGAEIYLLDAYLTRYEASQDSYYLWYNDPGTNPLLYTPEELNEIHGGIIQVAEFKTGKIYKKDGVTVG